MRVRSRQLPPRAGEVRRKALRKLVGFISKIAPLSDEGQQKLPIAWPRVPLVDFAGFRQDEGFQVGSGGHLVE